MSRTGRPPRSPRTALGVLMRAKRGDATAEQARAVIGVSRTSFFKIERGEHMPSLETAAKLATWLGLTVGQVIDAAREPVGEGG